MPTPTNPLPCGCKAELAKAVDGRLSGWVVVHCPLHAAAGELLAACEIAALWVSPLEPDERMSRERRNVFETLGTAILKAKAK